MSSSVSTHPINIRLLGSFVYGRRERRHISLRNLTGILVDDAFTSTPLDAVDAADDDANEDSDEPVLVSATGRKRAIRGIGRRQRPRRARGQRVRPDDVDENIPEDVPPDEYYSALSHTFEMPCIKDSGAADAVNGSGLGWWQEEEEFLSALEANIGVTEQGGATEPLPVYMHLNRLTNEVEVFRTPEKISPLDVLLVAPPLAQDLHLEAYDFSPSKHDNALKSFIELRVAGRAKIDARLRIHYRAHNGSSNDLPYYLTLELNIDFIGPAIFSPVLDLVTPVGEAQRRVLYYLYREYIEAPSDAPVDMARFYGCLHSAPVVSPSLAGQLQPEGLEPTLLPFQRNSLHWLLERERKTIGPDGTVVAFNSSSASPLFWLEVPAPQQSVSGKHAEGFWWMNALTGELSVDRPLEDEVVGGLLAEEPGLGKTIESMALVLLNGPVAEDLGPPIWSPHAEVEVSPVKGTLIVTPPSLCKQWTDELKNHAPGLKVLLYEGWNSPAIKKIVTRVNAPAEPEPAGRRGATRKAKDEANMDWRTYVGRFDVVLTTFSTLMKDVSVARPPIKRPRREIAVYQSNDERFRSPLVLVEWHRVIMDEVQLVGGGKAAEMVSLIPRRSSLAVSGTPAKAHIHDLIAPLRFLGIHHLLQRDKAWNRLLLPGFYGSFTDMFDRYAIRTHKAEAEGLSIPKQTRYVVPIDLGMIERHFYDQALEGALRELGLDARGVPLFEDWELDGALLRSWIRKLRMACIHPQVGALGGQAGPKTLGGTIRPIGEVLATMIDQNWQTMMSDRKALISAQVQKALLEQRAQDPGRYKRSLEMLLVARTQAFALIHELNDALAKHDEMGSKFGSQASGGGDSQSSEEASKGKGKEKEANPAVAAEEEEHRNVNMALQARVRDAQIILHRIEFGLGDLYHHFGKTKEEEDSYGKAETLRRTLLKSSEEAANRAIAKLTDDIVHHGVKAHQLHLVRASNPGILSQRYFDEANDIMSVLDEQRDLIMEWRSDIFGLLIQKIVSDGENADGHEYERALDSVMLDLNKLTGNDVERQIGKMESKRLRRIIMEQTALMDRLDHEQAPFRAAFNGRVSYFRQLQELSDTVAEIDLGELSLAEAIEENRDALIKLQDSIRAKTSRQRFLEYISDEPRESEEDRECAICNCDFQTGFLLACGHLFCEECLRQWRKKGQGIGNRCSTCREEIDNSSIHRISFGRSTTEDRAQGEDATTSASGVRRVKLNAVSSETLEEISKVESFAQQYGAKIQMLVRHLLYIEETEPGAKSIVFSAWADSLHIIEHALQANGITCIRIDANGARRNAASVFQTDPNIRVILLHGERENSGLNLTCAKRILLVEPTVNASFEIQAIARVDRLGQKEETEVYCYYAIDTVEQNILEIAARKGTSIYTLANASVPVNLASASTVEEQKVEAVNKDRKVLKGDFIAKSEQMLEVLFPDHFVEIEDIEMKDVIGDEVPDDAMEDVQNAVAGPSHS
ncbi:hypothetical protein FRB99_005746 [Tulasnella sp. 403]|nr:hypothetical protein FRB99_005746 [Tulasnella sp. 403]